MFGNFFKKKQEQREPESSNYIVVQLNARVQPMHRGEFFEDPLDEELQGQSLGGVSGGGTMLSENREIDYCDIEMEVTDPSREVASKIIEILERLGAPKGSKLKIEADGSEIPFGVAEGLAVYLNGTDLPDQVYKECDSNFVYSEFDRLLGDEGRVLSHWQGPTETALYLYGRSFAAMKDKVAPFLASYPLCQNCRIVQIA
jgi:hypothetical protein